MNSSLPWKFLFPYSAALLLAGCAVPTSGPVTITKVNPFHLNSTNTAISTTNPMLEFEPRHLLHGAVTVEDYEDRYGYYFTIFWTSETKSPATVRLEYRQGATGSQILRKDVEVAASKKKNTTKVQIIGDEYAEGGKVTQWKVTILEGGTKVAEYKSFLWKE